MSDNDRKRVAGRLLEFTRRERILLVAARGAEGDSFDVLSFSILDYEGKSGIGVNG